MLSHFGVDNFLSIKGVNVSLHVHEAETSMDARWKGYYFLHHSKLREQVKNILLVDLRYKVFAAG